jgi:hypothetical protein
MQNIAIIRVIALDGLFGIYYTIRHKFGPQHATRITTITKIAIPPDLASMFTACEDVCVPKTLSVLIGGGNHLTSAHNDRAAMLYP